MTRLLAQWMQLFAVLLMPLGMSGATAAPSHHHSAGKAVHRGCDDPGPSHHAMAGDCTMACASALPAVPARLTDLPKLVVFDFGLPATFASLRGILLEIATPPPRIA